MLYGSKVEKGLGDIPRFKVLNIFDLAEVMLSNDNKINR